MASPVTLEGLSRRFSSGERPALDRLSLRVAAGEIVSLVGPSGCGKSTTLRLIAGLDTPSAGSIRIGERDVAQVPPQERDVAMVFQGFALYPHMTVREILGFPLRMRRTSKSEQAQRIADTAKLLNITPLLDRRPAQLSGGEQQRVAMGRAIVRRPEVFLFDEPLSNLDAGLRAELRVELGKLLARLGVTALYVTHDQAEAMTLSHRIALLRAGKLEQVATPREIYERPATTFAAGFFGSPPMNLLPVARSGAAGSAGALRIPRLPDSDDELLLGIRPEHVHIGTDAPTDVTAEATVTAVDLLGGESHVELDAGGVSLRARVAGFDAPGRDEQVTVGFAHARVRWFSAVSGLALEDA
ncbi:MAG: ABC transporter ATP-binding protein [Polyangiaceae bacterium]|nr:ABC transporter ATP-binding protein [Polyangiaceae bacterium]